MSIMTLLPKAAKVTEHLVQRYGAEQLWQVEGLSDNIFRAWLSTGEVALAMVADDGSISVKEIGAAV